jgi:hypothetical protein
LRRGMVGGAVMGLSALVQWKGIRELMVYVARRTIRMQSSPLRFPTFVERSKLDLDSTRAKPSCPSTGLSILSTRLSRDNHCPTYYLTRAIHRRARERERQVQQPIMSPLVHCSTSSSSTGGTIPQPLTTDSSPWVSLSSREICTKSTTCPGGQPGMSWKCVRHPKAPW